MWSCQSLLYKVAVHNTAYLPYNKSQDSVLSLTISWPISRSHSWVDNWFSCFLKNSNLKTIWSFRARFQVRFNGIDNPLNPKNWLLGGHVWLHSFSLQDPTVTWCFHLMCRSDLLFLLFQDGRQQNIELQNLHPALKLYVTSKYPLSPLRIFPLGNLGLPLTFYPFLTTFSRSRFRISHIFPFGVWQVSHWFPHIICTNCWLLYSFNGLLVQIRYKSHHVVGILLRIFFFYM